MTKIRDRISQSISIKISRFWLGGYACAVWPIARVTCLGLSELSAYTCSVLLSSKFSREKKLKAKQFFVF
jgi:hypothetical protein